MAGSQKPPKPAPPGALLNQRGAPWDPNQSPTSLSLVHSKCLPQRQSGLRPSQFRKHKGLLQRKKEPPRRPPVDSLCLPPSRSAPHPWSTRIGPRNQITLGSSGQWHLPVQGRASPSPGQINKLRLHPQPLPCPFPQPHSLPQHPHSHPQHHPFPQLPLLCPLLRRQPLHLLGLRKAPNPALLLPNPNPTSPAQRTQPLQSLWTGGIPARWQSCGASWQPTSLAPRERTDALVTSRAQEWPLRKRKARKAPACQRRRLPRACQRRRYRQVVLRRVPVRREGPPLA